jgi:polysaccharide export outer membrane protein
MKKELWTLRFTLIGAILLSATVLASDAQTRQQKPQATSQTGADPAGATSILVSPSEDYRIGPRDVIEIKVDDAPELSITVPVNADGTFLMPYLKRVKAEGKTPEDLAGEIAERLRGRYLKDPNVTVAVKQFNSRAIFVLGAVRSPGVYQIEGKVLLLRLLTLAGGPLENSGSTAFILREIKRTETGNLKPGASDVDKNPADGSGVEPEFDVRTVNITGMFKGIGVIDPKSYLEPGDIVHIPKADVFFVAGEVNAPGSFPLTEGTTLRQAIALAQGTTMNAAAGDCVVFRQDPATGKRIEIHVDVGAVMKGRKEDVPILANDMVIVPNSRAKTVGNSILKALGMGTAQRGIYRY